MTDRDAFIRAICAHPHEDTPRLVFADWLDENGEPERAEFVRVQCELARLEAEPGGGVAYATPNRVRWYADCRAGGMLDRERELWESPADGGRWRIRFAPLPWPDGYHHLLIPQNTLASCDRHPTHPVAIVRRGLVDEVRCPLAVFLEHAETLFRQHPITKVVLTNCRALAMDAGPNRRWLYESYDHTGLSGPFAELPACLFWRLGRSTAGGRKLGEWGWDYPTADAADADLSAACVSLGRGLAGLPALEVARV